MGETADAFVAKLDPTGAKLIYATVFGGSAAERAMALAVSTSGQAHLAGVTKSKDFPTIAPLQPELAGESDAFLAVLDATGESILSTYFGGSGDETGAGVGVDHRGNIYLAGRTDSDDFPVLNAVQSRRAGGWDLFVATFRLLDGGLIPIYSTYLGGSGNEWSGPMAVDDTGSVVVVASLASADFPTTNALQSAFGGGWRDIAITKLDPAGSRLVWSTYLGGSQAEVAEGLALDVNGNAYVVGWTHSIDFPATAPLQRAHGGDFDVYVAKLPAVTARPAVRGQEDPGTARSSRHEIRDLGTLGGFFGAARGIDERGTVVGESETADGRVHAFLWTRADGMMDLGALNPTTYSSAWAINRAGIIVGQAESQGEGLRPAFWNLGNGMTELKTIAGWHNAATDVNRLGQVVGWSHTNSYEGRAVRWTTAGTISDLPVLGTASLGLLLHGSDAPSKTKRSGSSKAWGINGRGQIVGESETASQGTHAVLWSPDGDPRDLGTLGGRTSRALAVNDAVQIVGESDSASGDRHAFLWEREDAGMIDLGTLGGRSSTAFSINNKGQVVGYSDDLRGTRRAFLWTAEEGMLDLGTLGGPESTARAINDRGEIAGESLTASGARRAVLWQPGPRSDGN